MKKNILATLLVFMALSERVFFDLGPNVELVTMSMILAAMYLGHRYSLIVVLSVMVMSDILIGNSSIFIFTWTGFLLPAVVLRKVFKNGSAINNILNGTAAGVGANLFFFLWTNLGVWAMSSMYPNTAQGLMMSYVNGLPFLKLQSLSTLVFVPLGIITFEGACFAARRAKSLPFLRSHGLLPEKA